MSNSELLNRNSFIKLLGIVIDHYGDGKCEGHLDLEEKHMNPFMVAHGGAVFTLMDTVAGTAARSAGNDQDLIMTSNADIHYLRPAACGSVIARAEVIKNGATLIFVRAGAYSGENLLVDGTFEFCRVKNK